MQEHCCGADRFFNLEEAERERKRFFRRGPKSSTAAIIRHLANKVTSNTSLLDIGGGIGAIGLELQKKGLSSYTSVDASSGYQQIARELLAGKENWYAEFIQGDFVDESDALADHDLVSLDKVVCCYPQMEELLKSAAGKCRQSLALSFPPSGFFARLFRNIANLYLSFKGNPFRTFIHPEAHIHKVLKEAGLKPVYRKLHFPWRVEVWERPA